LSLYIADWIKVEAVKHAFGEMVAIQYAILSLSAVLYFFGKRIRAFTGQFGPMRKVLHYVEISSSVLNNVEVKMLCCQQLGPGIYSVRSRTELSI